MMNFYLQITVFIILQVKVWGSDPIHFTQSVYTITINETAPPQHPRPQYGFLNLTCYSPFHVTPTYSIIHSLPFLPFEINPDTGELNATDDIDYDSLEEGMELISFNVSCSDGLSPNPATTSVEIHVLPINEFLPDIDTCEVLAVNETTPNGTLLLSTLPGALIRLSVSDRDSGIHGELNYTILDTLDHYFSFDPLHANLTLVQAVDFESNTSIFTSCFIDVSINIRVCDGTTEEYSCPIAICRLYITASDDNEPFFTNSSYTATVPETTPVGSSILNISCYDADVYYGGVVEISILNSKDNEMFSLRPLYPGTVELLLEREIDFESPNQSYQFNINCRDTEHNAITSLIIMVSDVNDNAPIFSNHSNTIIVPDSTINDTIISINCSDVDSGNNGEIVYEILPQHTLFAIDAIGNVLVNHPLTLDDFVLTESHDLTIQCSDRGSPSLSSTKNITVIIQKTDILPPELNISNTVFLVSENVSIGYNVTILSVYDVDSESVELSIMNQTLPGAFIISSSSPYNYPDYPQLLVNTSLDREITDKHTLFLNAVSGLQNLSFSLIIMVSDVNDNAPQCEDEMPVNITEGYFSSTSLLNLSCSDLDIGINQEIQYTLTNISPPVTMGQFTINMSSGEVKFEGVIGEGEYIITLNVSDRGTPSLSNKINLHVNVEAISDNLIFPMGFIILIIIIAALIIILGVAIGCGLYYCRSQKKKMVYIVSNSRAEMTGVTIIPTHFPGSDSINSLRLVPVVEEVDRTAISSDEVTVTFNTGVESESSDSQGSLTAFLNEKWPTPLHQTTDSLTSSVDDLKLELEVSLSSFKPAISLSSSSDSSIEPHDRTL